MLVQYHLLNGLEMPCLCACAGVWDKATFSSGLTQYLNMPVLFLKQMTTFTPLDCHVDAGVGLCSKAYQQRRISQNYCNEINKAC